jgi:polysaccharide deacetylase family protein (PEP-CTERM system associated)
MPLPGREVPKKRPVRILHIITKLAVGGAQMNTLISARALSAMGYPSTILTGPEKPLEGNLFPLAEEWNLDVKIAPHLRRNLSPLNDILAYHEILREIRTGQYDVVHTHGSKARVLGRMAGSVCPSVRIVETAHGWPFYDTMPSHLRKLYVFLEKIGMYRSDVSIVVSPRDARKAASHGIHSVEDYRVIRSGVSYEAFIESRGSGEKAREALGLKAGMPVVGSVMRFCSEKAPGVFVEVASKILEKRPDVTFVLVGNGPLFVETRKLVASKGIGDRFLFTGDRNDVHLILPAFDVFLITSRTEGLPRTLLESLAAGIPVVSTDVGGVGELLKEGRNGILCPEGASGPLADGVLRILSEPGLAARLLERVDEDLEPFSAQRMVEDLYSLYTDVVNRRLKVVLLCDDEPVNIPRTVFSLIRRRPCNGYILIPLPGHGSVRNPLQNLKRYLSLYGFRAFPLQLARFIVFRIAAMLNLPTRSPHSLRRVARMTKAVCLKCGDINDEAGFDLLRSIRPDVILSIACPQILSSRVLEIPRLGAWNVHSALLPRNRGMLPTFWSLYHGDPLGVTLHRMTRRLDDGDILLQRSIPGTLEDTSLHGLLSASKSVAAELLSRGLDLLDQGSCVLTPNPIGKSTRNSFPGRREVRRFRDMGGRITGKASPRPLVGLSFDIEEWFQSSAARRACPESSWSDMAIRSPDLVKTILSLLEHHRAHATFFILGWIMERSPETVHAIVDAGHEIASHGYGHLDLTRQDRGSFALELTRFREICDRLSLPPIEGFRAPSFSIMPETVWAVDELVSHGYRYDSSVYPMFRHRYGIPYSPLEPYMLKGFDAEILELPMASLRTALGKLPVAGGAYMRFMPASLHRLFLRLISRAGRVPVLYLHPWELDTMNTSRKMSPFQRFRQHHNSGMGTIAKTSSILRRYRAVPLRELSAAAREQGVKESLDLGAHRR